MKVEIEITEDCKTPIEEILSSLPEGVYWNLVDPAPQQEGGQEIAVNIHSLFDIALDAYRQATTDSCSDIGLYAALEAVRKFIAVAQPERSGLTQEPVAEVINKYGDPEAFAEHGLVILADVQKFPIGTKFYAHPQAAEREGWRPIESISEDETVLLSKWHDGQLYWIASGSMEYKEATTWWCDVVDKDLGWQPGAGFYQPTHWMPLPAAPTGKGGV